MPRANRVLRAAERRDTSAVDTLILAHAQRQAQKGFLFGVKALDPGIFTGTPILLSAVALLAVWLPARRASQIDPMNALRCE